MQPLEDLVYASFLCCTNVYNSSYSFLFCNVRTNKYILSCHDERMGHPLIYKSVTTFDLLKSKRDQIGYFTDLITLLDWNVQMFREKVLPR